MNREQRGTQRPTRTMADHAMSLDRLDLWLQAHARNHGALRPAVTSLSMLDGFVTAVVAGPVSLSPPDWICPLLGVEPDAFNHDTEEFAAIAATAARHNAISNQLSTDPSHFEPLFVCTSDGEVNARPWCMGFYAAMKLNHLSWSRLLRPGSVDQSLLLPILLHCVDDSGALVLARNQSRTGTQSIAHEAWRDIAPAVEALRQFWMPIRFRTRA